MTQDPDKAPEEGALQPIDAAADNLDTAALLTSIVPVIGGPLSNLLGGIASGRRQERIYAILNDLAQGLGDLRDSLPERNAEYVRTDEFEELLEQTLRRAADERTEEKRKVYARFLAGAIKEPWQDYDEQMAFLRSLELLQPAQMSVLRAYSREDPAPPDHMMGSTVGVVRRRLDNLFDDARIHQLVDDLIRMGILNQHTLGVTMTADGAERTAAHISPFGWRFTRYLSD